MWFKYDSSLGEMAIAPRDDGRWNLWIDGVVMGSYHSPHAAADDVYTQSTGHDAWDMGPTPDAPCDLSEWTQVR